MRLFEIFDSEIQHTQRPYTVSNDKIRDKTDRLGYGHFSKVYQSDSQKRLNQVTKVGQAGKIGKFGSGKPVRTNDPAQDGYLSYINMVNNLQKSGNNNPFFPRIHRFKVYRENDGLLYYIAELEKLYDLQTPGIYKNEELINSIKERLFYTDEFQWFQDTSFAMSFLYITELPYPLDAIKGEDLKNAWKMINDLARKNNLNWDLGPQNLMWRMTGTMPQLVITDPLV